MENYNAIRLSANRSIGEGVSDILADHLINLAERHLGSNAHTLHRVAEFGRVDADNYTVVALCSIGSLCALVLHQVTAGEMQIPTITVFRTADVQTVVEDHTGVYAYLKSREDPLRLPSNVRAVDVLSTR
jgi:hypothetical protein